MIAGRAGTLCIGQHAFGVLISIMRATPRCSTNRSGMPAISPLPTPNARRGARIVGMIHAPPHHTVTRNLASWCDLKAQRIGDLLL
jgi:hypothetical protein